MSKPVHISLSGGGLRASFFHLGALKALAEEGRLANLQMLVTVSGGSIAAGFFLKAMTEHALMDCADIAFRELFEKTRRSPRISTAGSLTALSRYLVRGETGFSRAISRTYLGWYKECFSVLAQTHGCLKYPEWRIGATDYVTGLRSIFVINNRDLPRSSDARYFKLKRSCTKAEEISLAVAASTAVPFIFEPVRWKFGQFGDGGILDNQGLMELNDVSADRICVDASAKLALKGAVPGWSTGIRAMDVLMEQTRDKAINPTIRLIQLRAPFSSGHSPAWMMELANLRTDLDDFNCVEAELLFLAGYQAANDSDSVPVTHLFPNTQPLWQLMSEGDVSGQKSTLSDEVEKTLRRGRLRLFPGLFAPSFASVFSSVFAIFSVFATAVVIVIYILLAFVKFVHLSPAWVKHANAYWIVAIIWFASVAWMVKLHKHEIFEIGVPKYIVRTVVFGALLPIFAAVSFLVKITGLLVSTRNDGQVSLRKRISGIFNN